MPFVKSRIHFFAQIMALKSLVQRQRNANIRYKVSKEKVHKLNLKLYLLREPIILVFNTNNDWDKISNTSSNYSITISVRRCWEIVLLTSIYILRACVRVCKFLFSYVQPPGAVWNILGRNSFSC